MSERPIKLTIAALGGQGGGVLSDWLIEIAEHNGYIVQSTSVPGVAQRTGATLYYLEFFPRASAARAGREPVMALMPVPGDVDCVLAAELAEAGRAIQRGLVSDRTTVIASTHRAYAISEKSALGTGTSDARELFELVRASGRHAILFDMNATAERHGSLISAVLLGALCGSRVLPFAKESFIAAIEKSGIAVATNRAAFEAAHSQAEQGGTQELLTRAQMLPNVIPERAANPRLQPLLERIRALPGSLQPLVLEGTRRMLDYQDPGYAQLYLERIEEILKLDAPGAAGNGYTLSEVTARGLALWMTFEDTIRVAQLKTRATRVQRVRRESGAAPEQLIGITEFLRPRVAEIAGTLPLALGTPLLRSPRLQAWLTRFTHGRQVRTRTIAGFLMLFMVAGLRRWRRGTLRYREEDARISDWLARIMRLAPQRYALAVELARAQRLIKGYGETHERGWRNFQALLGQLELLAQRPDGADLLSRLQEAALADEEGVSLERELTSLAASAARSTREVPA
jgi:indolepyruvate ferredoxin oxidoreductase, beta subunit